jgi:hypothetical protein
MLIAEFDKDEIDVVSAAGAFEWNLTETGAIFFFEDAISAITFAAINEVDATITETISFTLAYVVDGVIYNVTDSVSIEIRPEPPIPPRVYLSNDLIGLSWLIAAFNMSAANQFEVGIYNWTQTFSYYAVEGSINVAAIAAFAATIE